MSTNHVTAEYDSNDDTPQANQQRNRVLADFLMGPRYPDNVVAIDRRTDLKRWVVTTDP